MRVISYGVVTFRTSEFVSMLTLARKASLAWRTESVTYHPLSSLQPSLADLLENQCGVPITRILIPGCGQV